MPQLAHVALPRGSSICIMLENGRKKTFKLGYGALTTVVLQYSYVYIYLSLSLSARIPIGHWILNGYMRMNMSFVSKKTMALEDHAGVIP